MDNDILTKFIQDHYDEIIETIERMIQEYIQRAVDSKLALIFESTMLKVFSNSDEIHKIIIERLKNDPELLDKLLGRSECDES